MANLFKQNPIILDTVWTSGTMPTDLATISSGGPQIFRKIVWEGATSGDSLEITDLGGNTIFEATCSATNEPVTLWDNAGGTGFVLKQSKWILKTLGSGKLLLFK